MGRNFRKDILTGINSRLRVQTDWQHAMPKINTACIKASANSPYCSGKFLEYQINWCADNFDNVIICVADLVLEFDYLVLGCDGVQSLSKEAAEKLAELEGANWDVKNQQIIDRYRAKADVLVRHSKYWRKNADFRKYMGILGELYETDREFNSSVKSDIFGYVQRVNSNHRLHQGDIDTLAMHTLEELVYDNIQASIEPTLFVYAGSQPVAYKYLHGIENKKLKKLQYRYFDLKQKD